MLSPTEARDVAGRPRVALTFDFEHPDRPTDPGVTAGLLDLLAAEGIAASVFVQGRWAEAYPDVARRIAAEGHLVGNHSHYHARMHLLTGGGLRTDIRAAEDIIRETTGVDPRPWFRCPFGAGSRAGLVLARLGALGYCEVGWDVDSRDWAGGSPRRVEGRVLRLTRGHGDGAVLLFHGWPRVTLAALPGILAGLRADGATFVRVDALVALPSPDGKGLE